MQWLLSSMRFKPFTWLLHIALTTIVVGACVTHFFGEQGEVHLRYDRAVSVRTRHSTITLFLWDFQVVTDPATQMPVDFITDLRLLDRGSEGKGQTIQVDEGSLRMNKPLKYHGCRFCQSDYDSDRQGVVLRYSYDPWGIGITYTGYALLLLSMVGFFFQRRSAFRAALKHLTMLWSRNAVVRLLSVLAVLIVVLAVVMTKVVTPKPPLQPVLQTPLLGIHVSVIMLAYTLFAIIAINGIVGLCSKRLSTFVFRLSTVLLYPAVFCLAAGIFIGAVWANMSWGRYWGWDPKETWALITMLVYAALLHFPWLKIFTMKHFTAHRSDTSQEGLKARRPVIVFHVFSIIAFFFVLFTYFGVSYFLGGLHSYT